MRVRSKPVSLGGRRYEKLAPGAADATPERLALAAATGTVRAVGGVRHLADPFESLCARQLIDREDRRRNDLLGDVGQRYRRHWHGSRLDNLAAFDFARDSVDGTRRLDADTPTEAAAQHRQALRRAAAVVGARLQPVLDGMVVEGRTAMALRHLVTDTQHARTADAIVLERLREALHRLGEHWRMLPQGRSG